MSLANIIGIVILSLVFIFIYGMIIKVAGWLEGILILFVSAIMTAIIALGIHLINL